ncbi:MAG: recombinase family protein [Eubacteriales bacterium]
MNKKNNYRAAAYVRLSKEDGDKVESMSITNQKDLIRSFVETQSDIVLCAERVDDGYSGANFERPSFQLMLEEIKRGEIDCIIVKDLSRFARNFVESERYLQQIFPFLGVRFIAINDNIDSLAPTSASQKLILPIKNLMNDAYLADLSVKIRSQFEIKRKKGEYISAHTPYGYLKSPENHSKIVVDQRVAHIVQEIFHKKIEGMSAQAIANTLNDLDILSPSAYKNSVGINHITNFQTSDNPRWSATAIFRILKNPIYKGTLVQGEFTTPNYKVKKRIKNSEDKCIVIDRNHEAIIDQCTFDTIQAILQGDARTAPSQAKQYPLSGLLICGDCGNSMVRRNNRTRLNPNFIYQCRTYKDGLGCSRHAISVAVIDEIVLKSINHHLLQVEDLTTLLEQVQLNSNLVGFEKQNNVLLQKKQAQYARLQEKQSLTFEKYQQGEISEVEFSTYSATYKKKADEVCQSMLTIEKEIAQLQFGTSEHHLWLEQFRQHKVAPTLTRGLVVTMIEKVLIYEDDRIEIFYRFQDEYQRLLTLVNSLNEPVEKVG